MSIKPPLLSKNANECLTPCIPRGTPFVHPVSIDGIRSMKDTCAINPILGDEGHDMIWFEECDIADNKTHEPPDEYRNLMLTFYFSPVEFLRSVYNITTFDDVVYWTTDNENLPFDTIKRVHSSAWLAFSKKPDQITNTISSYYHHLASTVWINDYVDRLEKNYSFEIVDTDIKQFVNKYLTKSFISKTLHQFASQKDLGADPYLSLVDFVFDKLRNKMDLKSIGAK